MPSCEENIQKLFEENPNLTDKEIIARMKELKDEKGKRLYKTSTIGTRLRQLRLKQKTSSEPSEIGNEIGKINIDNAKKEVEEAFGEKENMHKKVKEDETKSGFKIYDGRTEKKMPDATIEPMFKEIIDSIGKLNKRIDLMDKQLFQLKQGGLSVSVDELIDVQLRESIINKLDEMKEDESQELSETINDLIDKKIETRETKPEFLEKLSLDGKGEIHGKLFLHNDKWRFVKRARPIIYGIGGAVVGGASVTTVFILLKALELLPEWL